MLVSLLVARYYLCIFILKLRAPTRTKRTYPLFSYPTLFRTASPGILKRLDGLTEVVELLLPTPELPQQGPAILTESGAFKGLAADMCADLGLGLPDLSVKTGERLACILPAFAHISNPLEDRKSVV